MLDQLCKLGMSKRQLAKETGYSPEQVTRWKDEAPKVVEEYLNQKVYILELEKIKLKHEALLSKLREFI